VVSSPHRLRSLGRASATEVGPGPAEPRGRSHQRRSVRPRSGLRSVHDACRPLRAPGPGILLYAAVYGGSASACTSDGEHLKRALAGASLCHQHDRGTPAHKEQAVGRAEAGRRSGRPDCRSVVLRTPCVPHESRRPPPPPGVGTVGATPWQRPDVDWPKAISQSVTVSIAHRRRVSSSSAVTGSVRLRTRAETVCHPRERRSD